MRIGPESKMTDSQEQEMSDHIRCLMEFFQLCVRLPEGEMPEEVTEALREAADVCIDRVILMCATLAQISRGEGPSEHEIIANWLGSKGHGEA
jgi:hypothetical protein